MKHYFLILLIEPDNVYIIDGLLNEVIIDCLVDSTTKPNINWIMNSNNLFEHQVYNIKNEEFKSEILLNGSLKLSFTNSINKNTTNFNNKFDLIASFKCIANNSNGKITSRYGNVYRFNFYLGANEENTDQIFSKQPENATLMSGNRLVLKCKPNFATQLRTMNQNGSQIHFKWLKDGKQIIYSSRIILYKDGTLDIPSTDENDSGSYKCVAKYRSDTIESRAAIIKVLLPKMTQLMMTSTRKPTPIFASWPEDQSVQENDEALMECLAQNDIISFTEFNSSYILRNKPQLYSYKWLKDGFSLDSKIRDKSKRLQLIRGSNLRIDKLSESDSGTYTCRICNSNHDENYPDYETKFNNTRLDISSLDRDECDERSGVLRVLVPPKFIKQPMSINATLKSDVEFECMAYGVPKPQIQWFKNGEPIYPSGYFQFNSNQGSLKILGVIAQDEGYYQCLISNELNTIHSVAQLNIIADDYDSSSDDDYDFDYTTKKEKITSRHKHTTNKQQIVQLSAPVNLTVVNKKSRSFQIEWQKPSVITSPTHVLPKNVSNLLTYEINWKAKNDDRQRELNITQNSVLIDDTTADTVYLVTVCALLEANKSPCSTIEVKTDPELVMPGSPVEFKAELLDLNTQSQTTLKFKWKKPALNAENIIKYRMYYQHLNYGHLDANKKQNDYEFTSGESNENNNNMMDTNDDYSNDDEKSKISSEKYLDIEIPNLESSDSFYEFLLEDLLKYSTYKFTLVAINKQMLVELDNNSTELDENNKVNFKPNFKLNGADLFIETPSDVPDGPPENLQIEALNTTSVLFQWDMPSLEKRNGLIVGYKISIKENDKQIWHSNEDSEPRKKIINGLLPLHKYSIRVVARTQNGTGPASDWIIAETFTHEMDETRVPGQPVDLFTEPTDKSIVIRWLPPSDSNKTLVRKYLLKYGIGYPSSEVQISGTRNSYIINDLTPSSQYVISLKAINNAGHGMELLKDVFTKRKAALGENENLFPPLNVQSVVISPQSIELKWTDWHLKPEETIPDDRYYSIRYNIAEMSNAKYKFKNSTERNVILTDLKPNTLYDFSVRLVLGSRESDWSMTTSQMTMESSPAPRDITIKSDPNTPSTVIITWQAPNYSTPTGYVISYLDETRLKENPNSKWKYEHINANEEQKTIVSTIRKLKTDTTYYFKIQVRNNRAYGASSPTIIFKTPNDKGQGGGKIFMPTNNENQLQSDDDSANNGVVIPLNRSHLDVNLVIVVVIAGVASLFGLFLILFIAICCSRNSKKKNLKETEKFNNSKKLKNRYIDTSNNNNNDELTNNEESESNIYHKHSNPHQLLICHGSSNTPNSLQQGGISNASNNSTLLRQQQQQQQYQPHRTPSHNHSALVITNPNHMMMSLMNPLSINNNNNAEYYTNVNQQLLSSNSHANSDAADSCYQFNHSYNNNNNNYQQQNYGHNLRTSSLNEENSLLNHSDDLNKDLTNTSAALAAANAAFNAPINVGASSNNANLVEPLFLRHTIRPKPIAIPLNTTTPTLSETNSTSPLINNNNDNNVNQNMFSTNANTRKSFKNLPIATATLIASSSANNQSTNNSNHPLSFNFNDVNKQQGLGNNNSYFVNQQVNAQKIHYTARPYIIDNQVQSNLEYSNHSPASSCHSGGGQPQVYDKISTVGSVAASTKSLLQPLKSFGNNSNASNNQQSNSISIPNTPAKYCENFTNMARSPAKKQFLVSLSSNPVQQQGARNFNKSQENIYEKKISNNNDQELTAEMANLEGIMKDLNAITAQQFEC